jgi:hypothetical protein
MNFFGTYKIVLYSTLVFSVFVPQVLVYLYFEFLVYFVSRFLV